MEKSGKYMGDDLFSEYQCSYDSYGNIVSYSDGFSHTYAYDYLNRLVRENDAWQNKTVTYTYDNGGNILTKRRYSYTTGSLDGRGYVVVQYTYGNENWKDLLTAYNGNAITYDAIGNPLTYYNGTTFTWDAGRQLSTATKADGTELSFKYNDGGIRTSKTVGGVTTEYFLDGTSVIAEKTGNNILWFYYDGDGSREAMEYNGGVYYYLYNAQGDVLGLFDNNLNVVVNYTYDSWGNVLSVTGDMANTLGQANPFRYRGYYYDIETGLYYLNSRYYDPETGRFINADEYVSTGQGVLGSNMFSYCLNNPVKYSDPEGRITGVEELSATVIIGLAVIVLTMVLFISNDAYIQEGLAGFGQAVIDSFTTIVDQLVSSVQVEHRTTKNGSKKKTHDKHTRPRPGRQSEKKKQKSSWKPRNSKTQTQLLVTDRFYLDDGSLVILDLTGDGFGWIDGIYFSRID